MVNGINGRDSNGRFAVGNPGGRGGDSYARRCAELRRTLIEAVSVEDVREIARKLIEAAKTGDWDAAKILLDRVLGRPVTPILTEDVTPHDGRNDTAIIRHFMETDPNFLRYKRDSRLGLASETSEEGLGFLEYLQEQELNGNGTEIVGRPPESRRLRSEAGV